MRRRILTLLAMALTFASQPEARAQAVLDAPRLDLSIDGSVYALAKDGEGRLLVGGLFTSINGVRRSNLARILADGTVDPEWNPSADGIIRAMTISEEGGVYVGGDFLRVGGLPIRCLAKLSDTTGAPDEDWNVSVDLSLPFFVHTLAIDASNRLYVGGEFSAINGVAVSNLARLAGDSGNVDIDWRPDPDSHVTDIMVAGEGEVYVSGAFGTIAGTTIARLARLSSADGSADANWNPAPNGSLFDMQIDPDGALIVAGAFTQIGGEARQRLAKLSVASGAVDDLWDPAADNSVYSLRVGPDGSVYAGGRFTQIDGQARRGLARLTGTGGSVDPAWEMGANGNIRTIELHTGGSLYVGGGFDRLAGETRLSLARIGIDGELQAPLDAELSATVRKIVAQPDGGYIVAGEFLTADRHARRGLLRLLPDGELDLMWNPFVEDRVTALAVGESDDVYVGTVSSDLARFGVHKLSGPTGADAPAWPLALDGLVHALTADGNGMLYVGGAFNQIDGQPRAGVARLSVADTALDPSWVPELAGWAYSIVPEGKWVYIAGPYASIGGHLDTAGLARISSSDGAVDLSFDPAFARDSPYSPSVRDVVLGVGNSIYAFGEFDHVGGLPRNGLVKLDRDTGQVDPLWDPDVQAGPYGLDYMIQSLALGGSGGVFVSGGFVSVDGAARSGIARLTPDTGAVDPFWDLAVAGRIYSLVARGNALIVGGQMQLDVGGGQYSLAAVEDVPSKLFANGFE